MAAFLGGVVAQEACMQRLEDNPWNFHNGVELRVQDFDSAFLPDFGQGFKNLSRSALPCGRFWAIGSS